jgi:tight adherence protein B
MSQEDMMFYGLLAMAAMCVVAIIYLLLTPVLTGERRAEKRVESIAQETRSSKPGSRSAGATAEQAANRKRQVAEAIKEMEEQQKAKAKVSIRQMMMRAGLEPDPKMFWLGSAISMVVLTVLAFILSPGMPIYALGGVALVAFLGVPRWVLSKLVKRRQDKFLNEFANAIDVIVRGVKSGLPLTECLGIIARESPDPINVEFQQVIEQQRVGVPLAECFERMMQRVPLQEVRFFSIVIGIQQQAGGNLSEALGNLSGVLRDRKRLTAKVKALSAEAKASAAVLGVLPPGVMLLVYVTTPQYVALLWQKQYGQFMLLFGGFWMLCGILIMRKMINFKY